MSWFNWHTPAITPAEAAYAFGVVVVVNIVWLILARPRDKIRPDEDDGVHGDYPNVERS